jgi:hypothetical protein
LPLPATKLVLPPLLWLLLGLQPLLQLRQLLQMYGRLSLRLSNEVARWLPKKMKIREEIQCPTELLWRAHWRWASWN